MIPTRWGQFLTLMVVLEFVIGQHFQTEISNHPQFFYSSYCQIKFNLTSDWFTQQDDTVFLVTIVNTTSDVRFSDDYRPYIIHLFDGNDTKSNFQNLCPRVVNSNFQCIYIPSFGIFWANKKVINSTHSSHSFTIQNIICPYQQNTQNTQDVTFRIDVIPSLNSTKIVMSDTLKYKFTNLRYRTIQNFLLNPHEPQNTSLLSNQTIPGLVQQKYYHIGCQSFLTLNFMIYNASEIRSWQKLTIEFLDGVQSVKMEAMTCEQSIVFADDVVMNPENELSFPNETFAINKCQYSLLTNSLVISNSNFSYMSAIRNPYFYSYDVYSTPPMKLTFRFKIKFTQQTALKLKITMSTTTNLSIDDSGTFRTSSTKSDIIYFSKTTSLYSLQQSDISAKHSLFTVNCEAPDAGSDEKGDSSIFSIDGIIFYVSNLGRMTLLGIILAVLLAVSIVRKSQLASCQIRIYQILIASDIVLKIMLIIYVNKKYTELSLLLWIFCLVQYIALNFLFNLSYLWSMLLSRRLIFGSQQRPNRSFKSFIPVLISGLFNFKFYLPLVLNHTLFEGCKVKIREGLMFKHCLHLIGEGIVVGLSIVGFGSACNILWIWLVYCIQQSLLLSMMARVAASLLRKSRAPKKIKKESKKISVDSQRARIVPIASSKRTVTNKKMQRQS